MNQSELKKAFTEGTQVFGTMISSPSPRWVSEITKVGVDFVFIDTEHMPIDRGTMAWMSQAYKAIGVAPVVRVSSPDPYKACEAFDAGAVGVVFPYVETVEEVKKLVGAAKYRPLKGERLQNVLDAKEVLSDKEANYLKTFNNGNLVILNIESKKAVDNLDALLSVEGVDAVLIGPHDLSINLGIPEEYDNPLFEEYVEKIINCCVKHKKGIGNHFSADMNKQIAWAKKGMNICMWNVDYIRFIQAMQQDFTKFRTEMGQNTIKAEDAGAV